MGNDPINGIDPDGGYRTWIGAVGGWISGGLKGSVSKIGGDGNRNYAVDLTDRGNASQGAYIHLKFGGDLQQSMRDGASSINRSVTTATQPIRDWRDNLGDPYLDFNASFTLGVGAALKTPFGKVEAAFHDVNIGQVGFSFLDGGYAEWVKKECIIIIWELK